uniref:Efflux pump FUB11 (Fusaric acid biosynthesis protein 11) n=1 Tax=Ganoderma boninense TaxID=34458 RepID=A0A5K1K3J0_9APHY|nr:Efflux pump FUB11 (Fusaric acid biosynthesis protein 11) [Ganoderma boninense]
MFPSNEANEALIFVRYQTVITLTTQVHGTRPSFSSYLLCSMLVMPGGVSQDFPTTNVYTLDAHTGRLSHAIVRLPSTSDSYPTREAPSYALPPFNTDIHIPALGEGSLRIVEEIHIRDGETAYFVTKLDPRRPSSHGFVQALDACIRSAKRQVVEMERLVWQLEAVLGEDDRSYEADVDEPEDEPEGEVMPDSGYESDDEGADDFCWGTTHCLPSSYADQDPIYAPKSEEGEVSTAASPSLPSEPSDELVTFDPPSSSVTSAEELPPSTASATAPTVPIQIASPSVSAYRSDDFSAIEDRDTLAGDNIPPSLAPLESASDDDPISVETLPDNLGPGCPPTEEEPICLACYGVPIRLLWGDESSDESLSDLVDDLLRECDLQFDDLEVDQPPAPVDGPVPSPILAADWSLSQSLVSLGAGHEAKGKGLPAAGSTSSVESLFSESQDVQAELDSESEEEPLAETVKRRRNADKAAQSDESVEIPLSTLRASRASLPSDESVEIPLSTLIPLRVKKRRSRPLRVENGRPRPPATGQSASTGPSMTVKGETPPPGMRKRRRDDEKEEGEISEYETDPESEPDIPLSQVLAFRRRSQSTLGHGPPPAKRRRCTQHGVAEQHRVSSRESRRPRRSWVHRRWEERLRLRHARGGHEGRRGIRIMSTDEELIRRGLRALEGADRRREVRHHGSV